MTSPKEFLVKLYDNLHILQEREADYGSFAAPLWLINQIEHYQKAISLTEQAIEQNISIEELQTEFTCLNLEIRDTVEFKPARKPFDGRNPYRGLEKFTEDDHEFFFGRSAATAELVAMTKALIDTETTSKNPALLSVIGASGSGKSSLVRAGLIPALRNGNIPTSETWPIRVMLPGPKPIEALAETFVKITGRGLRGLLDDLHRDELGLHYLIKETLADESDNTYLILVIDQFEELFTLCEHEEERQDFIRLLLYEATHHQHRGLIILTMRADFYGRASQYPHLAQALTVHQMLVAPLTQPELREAILLPAEEVGLEMEKELALALVQDTVNEPGALPLLQHTLLELFNRKVDDHVLTLAAYQEIGGVRGALAHRADSILASLDPEQRELARHIFLRLTTLGEGISDTRRRVNRQEFYPAGADPETIDTVLQALSSQEARLIVAAEETVEVTHEALIQQWGQLRQWLEENRDRLRLHRRVTEAAKEWQANERDDSYLFRGVRLAEVEAWVADYGGELTPEEWAFVNASMAARERQVREEKERRQQELEQQRQLAEEQHKRAEEQARAAAKLRQRALYLIGALGIALLLGIAAGVFAMQSNQAATEAQWQSRLSRARELAAVSLDILGSDPELALHLAMQSISETHTLQGEDALRRLLVWPPVSMTLHGHTGTVYSVAYDGDGQRLVTASADGTARIWEAVTGQELTILQGHVGAVNAAAFSPNKQLVATAGADKTVRLWDVASGQPLRVLNQHTDAVNSVAFSPNGQRLVTASDDKTARVWQVEDGVVVYVLDQHTAEVRSAVFSHNGKFIATGGYDQMIHNWDAATGQLLTSLSNYGLVVNAVAFSPDNQSVLANWLYDAFRWDFQTAQIVTSYSNGHTWYVAGVAFSPDGRQVVTASQDHTLRIWDTKSGNSIVVLRGHGATVHGAAFDPAGNHLATASADQTVRIWDIAGWRKHALIGHSASILDAEYRVDGRRIATTSEDGTISIWDPQSGREIKAWKYPNSYATGVAFSPDGKQLITTSDDGTWRLWNAATGSELDTFPDTQIVHEAQFSHDGTLIITTGRNNLGIIWDATTKQQLGPPLEGHTDWVATGMFSPDGQFIVTASADASARIWNMRTHQTVRVLSGHSELVTRAAFSSDGKRIVTSSVDGTARVWDTATGQTLHLLKGHTAEVTDAVFSPDDRYIATSSVDDTVRLWEAATGNEMSQLRGHTEAVLALSFSPDGRYLLTTSHDGTARIYPVHFEDVLTLARSALSSRELTCVERVKYLHEGACPTPMLGVTSTP